MISHNGSHPTPVMTSEPVTRHLLELRDVVVHFSATGGLAVGRGNRDVVHAVDGIDLTIDRGASVAIVGETGSGKTTLARAIMGLVPLTRGQVVFDGQVVHGLASKDLQRLRRRVAIVAQDPFDALNPRQKVRDILSLPLRVHKVSGDHLTVITRVLEDVGLRAHDFMDRYPHEMSGGQRQRVAIARALTLEPELLIADEPVTALDMSIRAQVLNLLQDLKDKYGLTYLVVAHDLGMVRYLSDRVVVLYLGQVVEDSRADTIFEQPLHPYTQALMAAVPSLERRDAAWQSASAEAPNPIDIPTGCRFHPRCPYATERARTEVPLLRQFPNGTRVACHRAEEMIDQLLPFAQRTAGERK